MGSKTSHLEKMSPSARFSFTSPEPAFSPFAVTATTVSVTFPGIPVVFGPTTPDDLPASTVFVHVGCGSPDSNEEKKL